MEFEDLRIIKELGSGQFGFVYLVKSPEVDIPFALKIISKSKIIKENLEKYLIVDLNPNSARKACDGNRESSFHHAILQIFQR